MIVSYQLMGRCGRQPIYRFQLRTPTLYLRLPQRRRVENYIQQRLAPSRVLATRWEHDGLWVLATD